VSGITPKILPEELAVKSALPALRANIAKELLIKYDMRQKKVAELLGVTQTAISYYLRNKRGSLAQDSIQAVEVRSVVSEIAGLLVQRNVNRREVAAKFSQALLFIRSNRLLCNIHKQYEPHLDLNTCDVCDST
jgi:predicted transcriptional regulator